MTLQEPTDPGPRTQWAVRYDRYGDAEVPFYTHLSPETERWLVEGVVSKENAIDGIECTAVSRSVIYGGWWAPGDEEK